MFFNNAKRFKEVESTHRPYTDVSNAAQTNTIGRSTNTTIKIVDGWKRSSSPTLNGKLLTHSPPDRSISPSLSMMTHSSFPSNTLRITVDERNDSRFSLPSNDTPVSLSCKCNFVFPFLSVTGTFNLSL
jgi:hypothetical protein